MLQSGKKKHRMLSVVLQCGAGGGGSGGSCLLNLSIINWTVKGSLMRCCSDPLVQNKAATRPS